MSRNTDLSTQTFHITNTDDILSVEYENRVILTASETFVPPAAATAIRFTAVGGGGAGIGTTGGAGAGLFQKTFYAPWVGVTTSFVLTVGAVEGDTTLADSAGTSLAKAFGATAISDTNPVGVGGTSCGGDLNTSGSPGGIGVGGASGGIIADSVYDDTYAGRWKYFQESITNQNLKNYIISNFYISGGTEAIVATGNTVRSQVIDGTATSSVPAGLFSNGFDACSLQCSTIFTNVPGKGGKGGYGGNGGKGSNGQCSTTPAPASFACAGIGGDGGYGGDGGTGGCFNRRCSNGPTIAYIGCPGGAGGYGGNGGRGGDGFGQVAGGYSCSGCGGAGGFGGHGGCGGCAGPGLCACMCCVTAGAGGAGGFGGGGGRGGNATFTMCTPGNGLACCNGTQGMGGCGGTGGYGGGGGGMGCSYCPAHTNDCISARSGAGGAGAIIVEWTTKKVTN